MSQFLSEALRLAALGYKVLPLVPGEKKPLIHGGFKRGTTDPEQIHAWWTEHPDANIGLATGSGLYVVDIDDPAAVTAWDAEFCGYPSAATPRGGRHYFMRVPDGRWPNTAKKLGPKTDTRGDGGYVVAAPSSNGVGGWQWLRPLTEPASSLPEAPPALLDALRSPKGPTAYGRRALEAEAAKVRAAPEGVRNDTLNRSAFKVGQLVASGQVAEAEAQEAMLSAALAAGLQSSEAEATIRSGLGGGAQHPRFPQAKGGGESRTWTPPNVDPAVLICLGSVDPKAVEWLWPGRIPRGCLTLLAGPPGCGKSFLTLDLASRVSTGRPWPDGEECRPGHVLLISAEDDLARTVVPRLIACGADRNNITALQATRGLDGRERGFTLADVEALDNAIGRLQGVELVIIDPIGSYLGGDADAHRDNEVRAILAPIAELANRHGAAVLMVAHTRKSSSHYADDSVLGSRGFTGLARSVIHVGREPDGEDPSRVFMAQGKINLAQPRPTLVYRIDGDPPRVEWEADSVTLTADQLVRGVGSYGDGERKDTALSQAKKFILEALANGPMKATELTERGKAEGHSETTVNRARRELGVIAKREGFQGVFIVELPGCELSKALSSANDDQAPQGMKS